MPNYFTKLTKLTNKINKKVKKIARELQESEKILIVLFQKHYKSITLEVTFKLLQFVAVFLCVHQQKLVVGFLDNNSGQTQWFMVNIWCLYLGFLLVSIMQFSGNYIFVEFAACIN